MDYKTKYEQWISDPFFDQETRAELATIAENEKEIEDRFYKDLSFGTGGLRGIIGAGTNRMNVYTVTKATQGLANYIKRQRGEKKGVAIAFDSRHKSAEFSEKAALCLNANGIQTYRFETLRPTPELSFALRELHCMAGIVVTASHNPPEYNGYKVYWEDGAQITAPKDKEIMEEVNAVTDFSSIQMMERSEAEKQGLFHVIGKEIDDRYMEELKKLVFCPDAIKRQAEHLKIVYTPLHGTGRMPVCRILSELGFTQVKVVPEQEMPDGDFPTVSYPNPEDPKAFTLALQLAKDIDADLVLATDPDADRLGIYAKDTKSGEYIPFSGNMSGLLIAEYELSVRKKLGQIPKNGAIVKTIVSSNMANEISKEYGIDFIEVLTGFKYIGEQIKLFEQTGFHTYLFGYEESYGCLIGTHARDKDAVVAVMALCEAAAYYKEKGMTLWDQMLAIYQKYGYYKEDLISVTMKGVDGAERIEKLMENMRNYPPKQIGEYQVIAVRDYEAGTRVELKSGKKNSTELPKSNVLYYELERNAWCCVRSSGTEPKVKIYMGVKEDSMAAAEMAIDGLKKAVTEMVH